MDHPAVKLWRDKFSLNLSRSWKHDVEITVTDIELWADILSNWFWIDAKGKRHNKAPGIKNLLNEYERKSMEATNQRNHEAPALSARSGEGIPQRSDSNMREVFRKPPSDYFGTGDLVF